MVFLVNDGCVSCVLDSGIQADGVLSIWDTASLMEEGKESSICSSSFLLAEKNGTPCHVLLPKGSLWPQVNQKVRDIYLQQRRETISVRSNMFNKGLHLNLLASSPT